MKSLRKTLIFMLPALIVVALIIFFPASTHAAEFGTFKLAMPKVLTQATTFSSWSTFFPALVRFLQVSAIILFIILMLIGGIQYMASSGSDEGTAKAKRLFIDAFVGLFIVLSAQGILGAIFYQLGSTTMLNYLSWPYSAVKVTLPAKTEVKVPAQTKVTIPAGTEVQLGDPNQRNAALDPGTGLISGPDTPNVAPILN